MRYVGGGGWQRSSLFAEQLIVGRIIFSGGRNGWGRREVSFCAYCRVVILYTLALNPCLLPPSFPIILSLSQVYKLTSICLGGASPQAGCYEPVLQ